MQDSTIKNESESKCVLDLYQDCEKGLYPNIKKQLEDKDFSSRTLDIALRRCMKNSKRERKEYHDCLTLLLQYVDINYRNPNESGSTIIMAACNRGDANLVHLIAMNDYSTNVNFQNQKLDLSLKDDNGRNMFHYLINSYNQEEDALDILDIFFEAEMIDEEEEIEDELENNNSKEQEFFFNINTVLQELWAEDKEGYIPLCWSLLLGWYKWSKKIINLYYQYHNSINVNNEITHISHVIKINQNNLIHCSIIGKNLNCLKLVLKESEIKDLRQKTKDGLTPQDLAKKLELFYFAKIIENFEENYHNPDFIKILAEINPIKVTNILDKFLNEEYQEAKFLLNQLKINQSIRNNSKNMNIEWNIFLCKYYIKTENQNTDVKPESILSKFLDSSNNKNNLKTNVLREFTQFFETVKINAKAQEEDSGIFDIIIYNKGLFYYKIGDFIKTLNIYLEYLKFVLDQNDGQFYKWVIYVNVTFIIIEGLISLKYTKLVNTIINKLEEFLFTTFRLKKDDSYSQDIDSICMYLNSKEFIHKFTPTWDESFCFLNLLKVMKNIYEMKIDDSKIYFKEFKKLYKNCNYKIDFKIFDTMHNMHTCLKIKMYYCENSFSKCFKNLNKIYKLTKIEQINLTINDQKIDGRFNKNEYIMFYYNTMGIVNLKQKKFLIAEYFYKLCISFYKKTFYETKEFDFSIRLNWIYSVKYNLGLCYFFQKKYEKAYIIFKELSKNKNINGNIFLWYRIGLSLLEMEMAKLKKEKNESSVSDIVNKINGYEGNNYNCESSESEIENGMSLQNENCENYTRRIILQHNYSTIKNNQKTYEAIQCFKQVILLSKNNINCGTSLNDKNQLLEIHNFYYDKKSSYLEDQATDEFEKSTPQIKSMQPVINSSYLNLIFCLTLIENWPEVLFYCEEYEKSQYFKKDKDSIYKFDNYKIEALINLKQMDKAMELIKNNSFLINNNDYRGSFFNKVNNVLYNDVSFKLVLNVNMTKIHFMNNNLVEAEKCITNIFNIYNTGNGSINTMTEIPPYLQMILIYYHLVKGNYITSLNIIKFRKIAMNNSTLNLNLTNGTNQPTRKTSN